MNFSSRFVQIYPSRNVVLPLLQRSIENNSYISLLNRSYPMIQPKNNRPNSRRIQRSSKLFCVSVHAQLTPRKLCLTRFVRLETGDPSILELPCVTNLFVRPLSSLFRSISSRPPRTSPSPFPLWTIPPSSLPNILSRFSLGRRRCLNIRRCSIFRFRPRRYSGNHGSPRRFEHLQKDFTMLKWNLRESGEN